MKPIAMNRRELAKHLLAIGFVGQLVVWPFPTQIVQAEPISGWPSAANTGAPTGVSLAPHSGDLIVDTPGAVISGLDIEGVVTVKAPGVTIQNCRITANHPWNWYVVLTAGDTIIQDCTINGGNINEGQNAINGGGKFLRNNIFNTENAIAPGSNTTIQDNYIHDLKAPGSPHYDGIQIDGGQSDISIHHNTIINPWTQTSAVMIDNWAGPIRNIDIHDNLLIGGGYTIYVDGHFNNQPISDVSITNNHIGAGHWGSVHFNRTSPVFTGNAADGLALAQKLN
jgi:Right handed beta helix region